MSNPNIPAPKKIVDVPAVILTNPKYPHNMAGVIRACSCWGIPTLLWTGQRVIPEQMDRLPREERMKGYRDVHWQRTDRPFDLLPEGATPVCIELVENSVPLTTFQHPENPVYVFGPEDGGVPQVIRRFCHHFVHIPTHHCLNLSQAVNVVLSHRRMIRQLMGEEQILPLNETLHEQRGYAEIESVPGWDGK
jgi:tRNA(Leu) C34 or U34 (ribose-2'-O)-methylase TrmL